MDRKDVEGRLGAAMVELLDAVVRQAMVGAITDQKAKQRRDTAVDTMRALHCDLVDMAFGGPTGHVAPMEVLSSVLSAFLVYPRWSRARFEAENKIAIKNKKIASMDESDQSLVLRTAEKLKKLSGDRCYGISAMIASEVTERKITLSMVRTLVGPPRGGARRLIPAAGMHKSRRRGAAQR